jgi:hypothetical protein
MNTDMCMLHISMYYLCQFRTKTIFKFQASKSPIGIMLTRYRYRSHVVPVVGPHQGSINQSIKSIKSIKAIRSINSIDQFKSSRMESAIAAGTARAHATSNVGAANNHNSNNNSNERKSQFIK